MSKKHISGKIVNLSLKEQAREEPAVEKTLEEMHDGFKRPELLLGSTYKIKTPLSDHALYVTINDVILNQGTEYEARRPFEIFLNSKNMENFQWVVALTRVISAVLRKGGDVTFLVEELKGVFDPQGGYFKTGGRYMPSLVAEIGDALESHLKRIGVLEAEELSEVQKEILAEKRAEYEAANQEADDSGGFPPSATLCAKCNTKALIVMDGCKTCLSCGDSKCG